MLRRTLLLLTLTLVALTPAAGALASSTAPEPGSTACPIDAASTSTAATDAVPDYATTGPSTWEYGAMRGYERGFAATRFDPFKTHFFWFQVFEFPNGRFPAAWLANYTVDILRQNYEDRGAPALKLEEISFPFALAGDGCRAFAGRLDQGEVHPRVLVVAIRKGRFIWMYSASGIAADFVSDLTPMMALLPADPEAAPGSGLSRFLPLPGQMPVGYLSIVEAGVDSNDF